MAAARRGPLELLSPRVPGLSRPASSLRTLSLLLIGSGVAITVTGFTEYSGSHARHDLVEWLVGVALAGAGVSSWMLQRRVRRALERLTAARTRLGESPAGDDEAAQIEGAGAALDRLAENLASTRVEQLRSERELAALLESITAGVVMVTRGDRRVLFANRRFTELTGAAAVAGQPLIRENWRLERADGTPIAPDEGTISRVMRSGQTETIADALLVTEQGQRTPVMLTSAPVRLTGSGDFDAVVAVLQDRRELAHAVEQMQDWAARFRAVARATGQTVYEWWLVDDRVEFSEALVPTFGWSRAELATHASWAAIVHPDDAAARSAEIEASRIERRRFSIDYRVRHRDGGWRWVRDRGEHRTDENGRAVSILGALADVTDQRHLEAQLRQAQKMETLGTLAGGIAHDFNNQLTAVIGHLTLIEEELVSVRAFHEQVRHARRAAERCAELTRGLVAFSRMPPGNPRPTSIAAMIEETCILLRRLLPPGIVLLVEVDPSRPHIIADPGQLQQMLLNLCTNARDAMPGGGTLQLTTRAVNRALPEPGLAAGEYLEIEVADTGVGIPPEVLPRIFEPFFSTKPVGQGTGLGLAIVYGIVTHHRGRIDVESTPRAGTTFRVLLPAAQTIVAEAESALPPSDEPISLEGRTILVVDDEPGVAGYVARVLESAGALPITAIDGDRALAKFVEDPARIDCVVMDLTMPGTPVRLIVEGMRRVRPGLPLILMSGFAADSQVLAEMPGVPFLPKPFTPRRLLQLIVRTMPVERRAGAATAV